MNIRRDQRLVLQNMSWLDRAVRFVIGIVMLFLPLVWLMETTNEATWHVYSIIASIYPLLSSILGIDPIYKMFKFRSCGTSKENACGTFPFQVASIFNKKPVPKTHKEHSLEASEFKDSARSTS